MEVFSMPENNKGITLIELLVGIVILGIIGAMSTPLIGQSFENMQKDKILEDSLHIERAAENYCLRPENACPIGEDVPMEKLVEYIDGYDESYTVTVKRISERSFGIYYASTDEYSFPFNQEGKLISRELSARTATRDLVNIPGESEDVPDQDLGNDDNSSVLDFPEWEEGAHSVGDRIQYDGKVFEIRHGDGVWSPPTVDNLRPYGGFQEVEIGNSYRAYNTYTTGDTVRYQGMTYTMRHEGGNGEDPSTSLAWQAQTMRYTPYNVYDTGDSVVHKGSTYIALNWGTGIEPGTEASTGVWQNISSDKWEPYNTYDSGDTVEYKGTTYKASYFTQNDNPETSSVWSEVNEGNEPTRWRRNEIYLAGDRVIHGNTTYEAQWWTQGDNPKKHSGDYEVWQPVN
jgi:prepilin-type N-terminal cleavage/methylation domain-containing protein